MATITIEQKVITVVSFNDVDVNDVITAQNEDLWNVVLFAISGTDMIILFTRITTA